MPLYAPRRLAFTALATLATSAAVAGCGSSDGGSGSASSGSSSSNDGATLLKTAFKTNLDAATARGYVSVDVKGTFDAPKDKDVRHLSGEAGFTASFDKTPAGKPLPPLAVTFSADGDYTDGHGKSGTGKYAGGVSYVGDQFYANWQGKDYAVGSALTQELMTELQAQTKKAGVSATTPLGGVDPNKLISAMDLDPSTWFKSTTVTDGGQVEGEDTQKVSGPVDVKAVADDVTTGLKALPAAVPQLPGVDKLKKVNDISAADLADAEQAIKVLNASIWVGKTDHVERQIQVQIQVDEEKGDEPGKADLTLTITNTSTPKPIVAPKNAAPITDLILEIQKEFGGPGGPLHKMFEGGAGSIA